MIFLYSNQKKKKKKTLTIQYGPFVWLLYPRTDKRLGTPQHQLRQKSNFWLRHLHTVYILNIMKSSTKTMILMPFSSLSTVYGNRVSVLLALKGKITETSYALNPISVLNYIYAVQSDIKSFRGPMTQNKGCFCWFLLKASVDREAMC